MIINEGRNTTSVNEENAYISKEKESHHPFHPCRRYFARMLDISIYTILWLSFIGFTFHVNIIGRSSIFNLLDSFIAVVIMLFLEPLWLKFFRTTPGKAIFGIRLEDLNGKKLSYSQGLERTAGVIVSGLGFNIPIYSLIRLWKSYNLCIDKKTQPWNESTSYIIKDTKLYRTFVYIGTSIAIFAILFTIVSAQKLPPNRNDLTVEEFVENYNYYANYFDIDFGNKYLNEKGKWSKREVYGGAHITISRTNKPEYNFMTENGYVTGVSFEVERINNENWISSYDTQMILSSLAFINAQEEIGIFSNVTNKVVEEIEKNSFEDINFEEAGVVITSNIEYSGYKDFSTHYLIPEENTSENFFALNFSIEKQSIK